MTFYDVDLEKQIAGKHICGTSKLMDMSLLSTEGSKNRRWA